MPAPGEHWAHDSKHLRSIEGPVIEKPTGNAVPVPPGAAVAPRPTPAAQPRPSSADAPPTALVVDDDTVLRISLQRFCENQGFSVRACKDGSEALDSVRQAPTDVVLLDAQMPVMDGFDACAAIRALPDAQRIPIIMITANADEASVDRAFAVGANEYITKPVHWAVLGHGYGYGYG